VHWGLKRKRVIGVKYFRFANLAARIGRKETEADDFRSLFYSLKSAQ
jgi:hypothetical protein